MTGRIIEDDLFGICRRLKSIDEGYFVFLNYKTGKLEVHHDKCHPNTLCLVLPYETLDERTYRKVLYTRRERLAEILESMERENERIAKAARKAKVEAIANAVG